MSIVHSTTRKCRLTKRTVESIIDAWTPEAVRRVWDSELSGFYLSFTPAGVASYCLRYTRKDGRKADYTIGRASLISPDQARDAARQRLAAMVLQGEDPVAARMAEREEARKARCETFGAVAEAYIADRSRHRVGRPPLVDEYVLKRYITPVLGSTNVKQVTRQMVKSLVEDCRAELLARSGEGTKIKNGNHTANRVQAVVRRVFDWAIDAEIVDRNPARFRALYNATPERRVGAINEARFKVIWNSLKSSVENLRQFTPYALMLYFLTLQRPIDICRARKQDFDFVNSVWRVPATRTKTGRPYEIPLSEMTLDILRKVFLRSDSDWLFPGIRGNQHTGTSSLRRRLKVEMDRLVKRGALESVDVFELYDFRRFGRTQIRGKLGFPKEVAERVINHAQTVPLSELYDVTDYAPLVREAHNAWAEEVERMIKL